MGVRCGWGAMRDCQRSCVVGFVGVGLADDPGSWCSLGLRRRCDQLGLRADFEKNRYTELQPVGMGAFGLVW